MVDRWHLLFDIGGPEMTVHPRGEYVRHSDYAALEAELAAARAETIAVRKSWSDFADNVRQRELSDAESRLSEIEKEVERLQAWKDESLPICEAARGLCFGEDWNAGNNAIKHGYRRKLMEAVAKMFPGHPVSRRLVEGGGNGN